MLRLFLMQVDYIRTGRGGLSRQSLPGKTKDREKGFGHRKRYGFIFTKAVDFHLLSILLLPLDLMLNLECGIYASPLEDISFYFYDKSTHNIYIYILIFLQNINSLHSLGTITNLFIFLYFLSISVEVIVLIYFIYSCFQKVPYVVMSWCL